MGVLRRRTFAGGLISALLLVTGCSRGSESIADHDAKVKDPVCHQEFDEATEAVTSWGFSIATDEKPRNPYPTADELMAAGFLSSLPTRYQFDYDGAFNLRLKSIDCAAPRP